MTLISMNVRLDLAKWFGGPKEKTILTLRGENLLNQEVYAPNPGAPSYPYSPGVSFYAGLVVSF